MRHVYECPMRWADMDLHRGTSTTSSTSTTSKRRGSTCSGCSCRPRGDRRPGRGDRRRPARGALPRAADLPGSSPSSIECWVTDVRAASFTMAYEVFHDDPGEAGGRRVYLRATSRCLRHSSSSPTPRAGRGGAPHRPDAVPRGPTLLGRPHPPHRVRVRRDKVGHYPVRVRFSDVDVYGHVNNVKYLGYTWRPASCSPPGSGRGSRTTAQARHDGHGPQQHRLRGPDPVPSRAVRRLVVAGVTWGSVRWWSSRASTTATGCSRGRGWPWSSSTRRRADPAAPPPEVRERLLRRLLASALMPGWATAPRRC